MHTEFKTRYLRNAINIGYGQPDVEDRVSQNQRHLMQIVPHVNLKECSILYK